MFIKSRFMVTTCISGFFMLAACAPTNTKTPSQYDQLNQICKNLKQQIIMDANNNVPGELGNNPTKEAEYYKNYDQYHCDEVLSPLKNTGMTNTRTTNNNK